MDSAVRLSKSSERFSASIGHPNTCNLPRNRKKRVCINASSLAKLVWALATGQHTASELVHHTGLGLTTVKRYVHRMHEEQAVRIADWETDGRGAFTVPVFAMVYPNGPTDDKRRPKPLAANERSRRYRARKKAAKNATHLYWG